MKTISIIMMILFIGCGGGGGDSPTAKAVDDPTQPPIIEPTPPEVVPEEPTPTPLPGPEAPTAPALPGPEDPIAPALPKPEEPIAPSLPKPTPPPVVEPEPPDPTSISHTKAVLSNITLTFTTTDGRVFSDLSPYIQWTSKTAGSTVYMLDEPHNGNEIAREDDGLNYWGNTQVILTMPGYSAYADTTIDSVYAELTISAPAPTYFVYVSAGFNGSFVALVSGWVTISYENILIIDGVIAEKDDFISIQAGYEVFVNNNDNYENSDGSQIDQPNEWWPADAPFPQQRTDLDYAGGGDITAYFEAGESGWFHTYVKGLSSIGVTP
jgi:hypothetical protein